MSAKKRARGTKKAPRQKAPVRAPFYEVHPNWTAVGVLLVVLFAFYYQVIFYNQTLLPPDTLASKSFQPFVRKSLSEGEYPKWNPYIFSGMPSFASLASAPYVDLATDFLKVLLWIPQKLLPGGDFLYRLVNYFIFGLFAFLYLRRKGILPAPAAYTAVGLVLLPQVVAYAAFGHGTKLNAVAFIPLIMFLVDELMHRRSVLLFAAASLAVGLQLLRAHVQISYYTFLLIGLYLIWTLGRDLLRRRLGRGWVQGTASVLGAIVVGAILSSWLYLSVYEYSHFSIRGGTQGGLEYGYATNWSFHPAEIVTFFVPSFFGFGGNTYWGHMPFTDFPMYFGVTVFLLALVALAVRRDHWTWFLAAVAFLALVVSFGRHFPLLYDPMFKLLPFFNKFRVPVMIQILLEISVLLLAGVGLHTLLTTGDERAKLQIRRLAYVFGAVVAVLFLFLVLGRSTMQEWIARSGKVPSPQLQTQAYEMAVRDGIKALLLVALLLALVLSFLARRIGSTWLVIGVFALLLVDLWPVSHRLLSPQPKASEEQYFHPDEAVSYVKRQPGLFRIFPVADGRSPNWYAYHLLQNIYGYHAAKLRIYQTFLEQTKIADRDRFGLPVFLSRYFHVVPQGDRFGLERTPAAQVNRRLAHLHDVVLDMLNVRYLLSLYPFSDSTYRVVQSGRVNVIENMDALPRAFLVDSVLVAQGDGEVLAHLRAADFDPRRLALLEQKPPLLPQKVAKGEAKITHYGFHRIEMEVQADRPACLVVSEVYYPAGWKAFVDGEKVRIYKTNYILRSVFLPAGKHRVEFIFDPWTFKLGLWVTIATTAILLTLMVWGWRAERGRTVLHL